MNREPTNYAPEWFELRYLTEDFENSPSISCLSFDPSEELLWVGRHSGRISSYHNPTLDRYSSFMASTSEIRQILVEDNRIISISAKSWRTFTKGGLPLFTHRNETHNFTCAAFCNQKRAELLVGGESSSLLLFDVNSGRVLNEVPTTQGTAALKRAKLVCCGGLNGELTLRDPRSLRVEHSMEMFNGGITDIDVKGDLLVACGWSKRMGQSYVDTFVKVFDIRMMRTVVPIPFPPSPFLLKFHPKFSSTLIIVSQSGYFQLCDVQGDLSGIELFQIDSGGQPIMAFDISSTGEVMGFGDGGGTVHQWSDRQENKVNVFSSITVLPDLSVPVPRVSMNELTPLSACPLTTTEETPLSRWPTWFIDTPKPPKDPDPELLVNLKQNDFVGYVPNTGAKKRNPQKPTEEPRESKTYSRSGNKGTGSAISATGVKLLPTKHYKRYEYNAPKLGLEIDIGSFNNTEFGGLENSLQISYINPIIQMLYYIPHIRATLLNHLCQKEFCLACELGFLFHMFDISNGSVCQASNFIRALSQIPKSLSLGLIEEPDTLNRKSLIAMTSVFSTFLLEQLHYELVSPDVPLSIIEELLGYPVQVTTKCFGCNSEFPLTAYTSFVCELVTPEDTSVIGHIKESLSKEYQETRFCDRCYQHQPHVVRTVVTKAPNVLCFSLAKVSPGELSCRIWDSEDSVTGNSSPSLAPSSVTITASTSSPSNSASPSSTPLSTSVEANAREKNWLPARIRLRIEAAGEISVEELGKSSEDTDEGDIYELMTVVSCITDTDKLTEHLVAQINVPGSYHKKEHQQQQKKWYIFNDHYINHSSFQDASDFPQWKRPTMVTYVRADLVNRIQPVKQECPISADVFLDHEAPSMTGREKIRLDSLPKKGELLALDAEFICLEQEDKTGVYEGNPKAKVGRFGLARVSVITSNSNPAGDILIDDYIISPEPVADYLTRFSGIQPNDLDPKTSSHHLTTLKKAYLKLRYLVDIGCIFVGHGLQKDFGTINIIVPPEQVIDTVELFHLKRQRKISLRFLSIFLLNKDIQTETHCSVEDAKTAYAVYQVYQKLTSEGKFESVLQQIYNYGRAHNWVIRSIPSATTAVATTQGSHAGSPPSPSIAASSYLMMNPHLMINHSQSGIQPLHYQEGGGHHRDGSTGNGNNNGSGSGSGNSGHVAMSKSTSYV